MQKKYMIGGKEFIFPEKVKLLQYELVLKKLSEFEIDLGFVTQLFDDPEKIKGSEVFRWISSLIGKLIKEGAIRQLLSYILVESGKDWNKHDAKENAENSFNDLDVSQTQEIIIDFFGGSSSSAITFLQSLNLSLYGNKNLMQS